MIFRCRTLRCIRKSLKTTQLISKSRIDPLPTVKPVIGAIEEDGAFFTPPMVKADATLLPVDIGASLFDPKLKAEAMLGGGYKCYLQLRP